MNPIVMNSDERILRVFQPEHAWPRRLGLELAATASSVPQARSHARRAVSGWGFAALADTAGLLVSELATNAVAETQRAPGGAPATISLRVTAGVDAVLIEVHDFGPGLPVLQDTAQDAEHGRGLLLVAALSASWGTCQLPGRGKIVWSVAGLA